MLRTDTVYAYNAVKVYCKRGTDAKASIFTDFASHTKKSTEFHSSSSQYCYSVLMRKNTYNSNVICGLSRTRLCSIADCTQRGYCLLKGIILQKYCLSCRLNLVY